MRCRPLFVFCLLLIDVASPAFAVPAAGTLTVDVVNLRADKGWEMCGLFSSPKGFPLDLAKVVEKLRVPIKDGRATCEFAGVVPGTYAVSAVRDESGKGVPETDLFDIPKNGVGTSNDAKGFMTLPKFDDAQFDYPGGKFRLTITMPAPRSR